MTQIVEFDGVRHEFPDDFSQADIARALASAPESPGVAADVAKQLGAGLVTGLEAIPAAPAHLLGAIGEWGGRKLEEFAPALFSADQQTEQNRQKLKELIAANRGGGIADYLPKPETTAGEYARTAAEFVPAMVGATRGNPLRAAGVGATAGATSEAAGQRTQGTQLEPYARVFGGTVGGMAGAKTLMPRAVAAPTIEQVKQAAAQAYQAPEIAGVVLWPQAVERLAGSIRSDLQRARLNERLAPQTHELVDNLRNPVTDSTFHRIEDIETTRQLLGRLAGGAPSVEQAAASRARAALDRYLANVPRSHLVVGDAAAANEALTRARANYASAKAAERVAEKLRNAELQATSAHSGGDIDNATRQELRTLLTSRTDRRGLSEDELARIEQTVRGSTFGNALRAAGRMLGGGGGRGAMASAALGGAAFGAPHGFMLPLVGYGLKKAGDTLTRRQADAVVEAILARSPLGRSIGAGMRPPHVGVLPGGLLGGLIAARAPGGLLPLDHAVRRGER